jgi:hypothetical protein
MASKAPAQPDNNKKVLLVVVLALVIVLAGWRVLSSMFGGSDEAAARAVEQSVKQDGGPVGPPGVYRQFLKQRQAQPPTPGQ